MPRQIAIIQGHPSPDPDHFCHALAAAYARGCAAAGHEVREIRVAALDFPLLHTKAQWEHDPPPPAIQRSQETINWAQHLVIIYPLWLGTMPAVLKAFFEQVFRPGFAIGKAEGHRMWAKRLTGRSARIVVTMGMPAVVYRWYFGAHSLKSLERNILGFCGIGPIRESLIGMVEGSEARRRRWLERLHALGRQGR